MEPFEHTETFKIIIVGDRGVGKTSFINSFKIVYQKNIGNARISKILANS
jgi:GTPase SAR1 family protein